MLEIVPEGEEPASITLTDAVREGEAGAQPARRTGSARGRRARDRRAAAASPADLEGRRDKDCAALAETAALIVERYLFELERPPAAATAAARAAAAQPGAGSWRWPRRSGPGPTG